MDGSTTFLFNPVAPKEEPKKFAYDFSYWSNDGYIEQNNGYCTADLNHPNGSKYADQAKVYDDLGRGVLNNAWEGYNSTLFAYGQTGSGKSYSVIGYGPNKGIVPLLCEELFQGIEEKKASGDATEFEVRFSMLEIYSEVARDLLGNIGNKKKGLKIREHPKKGFYADGLKTYMVTEYKDIQSKIEEGTLNRSIASTNMNATSSRAHTIVGITLIQKAKNAAGQETAKTSVVNLVDLAGSERVSSTGATGNRLKEGAAINQSLSCLGNCIHALAEKSSGRNTRVPFRDSVLTRLLMNALGGNSKTVMVAAISPADINYEETLSTLRYADRAKQIKTLATINEDPTEKLIRELREENEKLKKSLQSGRFGLSDGKPGMSEDEMALYWMKREEEMKARLTENNRELMQMKQSYEEKLQQAHLQQRVDDNKAKIEEEKKKHPHLANLNFDPLLSGKITHIIKLGKNTIGKSDTDITLFGPSIHDMHAVITRDNNGVISIERCNSDSRILLNGDLVTSEVVLSHCDRIMFGTTQLYVYNNPEEAKKSKETYPEVTYEMAQEEIVNKSGINMDTDDQSLETALLNTDLLEVLPGIDEANSISEELDKCVKFEIMLISPQMVGKLSGRTEVLVKMRNLENKLEFEWPKDVFLNRLYVMKEMYQNYESGEEWDLPKERDPFIEDINTEVRIGNVQVFLQPLAYMVEQKEQLEITDFKGTEVGIMNVEVVPCTETGKEYSENDDVFIDNPTELIGKNLHFIMKIHGCRGLPNKYRDIRCKYRVFLDEEDTVSEIVTSTINPDFNHQKMFSFKPVTQQLVDYLNNGAIMVQVWGKQKVRNSVVHKAEGKNTKQMFQADLLNHANKLANGFRMNGRTVDPDKQSIIVELLLMKKQQSRQQQRLENFKNLITVAEKQNQRSVPVYLIKDLLSASTPEAAEPILAQLSSDDEYGDNNRVSSSSACILL
ncbi:kinesin-like protein KIF28 isoform X1 [Tachypleus tridentatus]|uniref:kinesin-like protein KIF28 isoform X1 n=2 Tax=Tachypleus tridentatus TaxID=6853 RepID=UPI003FD5AE75